MGNDATSLSLSWVVATVAAWQSGSPDQPGNRCGVTASDIAVRLAVN